MIEAVIDGDTFTVTLPGVHPLFGDRVAVRIDGIDTPDMRGACDAERAAAIEARRQLFALLSAAQRVDLESVTRDKYGRLLARVLADRRDVGEQLVEQGLARRYSGGARQSWCP